VEITIQSAIAPSVKTVAIPTKTGVRPNDCTDPEAKIDLRPVLKLAREAVGPRMIRS
jgi:hypothetical protein